MMKHWVATLSFLIGQISFANTCYLTVLKEDCWQNYDLTVNFLDFNSRAQVAQVKIKKGAMWGRVKIECQPKQTFLYHAQFLPVIWESEAGRVYWGTQAKTLPAKLQKSGKAWHLGLCFSREFSRVPFPPDARQACKCDWKQVPPVKIKKAPQ